MSVYTDAPASNYYNPFFDFAVPGTSYGPEYDDFSYLKQEIIFPATPGDYSTLTLFQDSGSTCSSDSFSDTSPSPHQGSPLLTSTWALDYSYGCPLPTPFNLHGLELQSSVIDDRYSRWDPFQSDAGVIDYPTDQLSSSSEASRPTSVCPADLGERVVAPLPTRSHYVIPSSPSSDYDADSDEDSEDYGNDEDYEPDSDSVPFRPGQIKRVRSSKVQLAPESKRPRTESRSPKQRGRAAQAPRSTDSDDDEYKPASAPPSPRPSASAPSPKRRRAAISKRNKLAEGAVLEEIHSLLRNRPGAKESRFECPMGCRWTQGEKRMPDFVRHLKTHLDSTDAVFGKQHTCHCGDSFSRPDALGRHQRNSCGNKKRVSK